MDPHQLNAFLYTARLGSFSHAAEQLFLTQPAVSKRIAALEADLGVQLFYRLNRQVKLTTAGEALLPRAENLLNEINDLKRFSSNLTDQINGRLAMSTSHHIGLHRLAEPLKTFKQRYPSVSLDLEFVDSEDACQQVEKGDLEIAVATLPTNTPEALNTLTIWFDQMWVVVAPDHPLALTGTVTIDALLEHPCVLPSPQTFTHQLLIDALGKPSRDLNIAMTTNYIETLKMLVKADFGWSLIPHTLLDEALIPLNTPWLKIARPLGVITHKKRTLSNAAAAMLNVLVQSGRNAKSPLDS